MGGTALTQVDKLEFVQHVQRLASEKGRNAELALYRRCPEEAESMLLNSSPPLVYRAIKLNVRIVCRRTTDDKRPLDVMSQSWRSPIYLLCSNKLAFMSCAVNCVSCPVFMCDLTAKHHLTCASSR